MEPSLNTRGTLQRVTNNIRIASLGAVLAASLLLAAGAEANAPPGGVDLCGASGDCVNVPVQDAETNWALWSPASQSDSSRTSAVAPFLLVRWQWPDQPMQTAYYVPSTGKTRQTDSTGFLVSWFKLQNAESALTAVKARDRASACNATSAFLNEVQAQAGKLITAAQANQLTAAGKEIRAVLGCR